MTSPFIDFGGSGSPIFFFHANGFPPACYRSLLTLLSEHFHVSAMVQRPLWPGSNPAALSDWFPLTDDLLKFLDSQQPGPVACIGHSMGGIALLRAAIIAPERFSAIVLIDPVLFPPYIIRSWQIIRSLGLGYKLHPLVRASGNRRRQFDNLDRLLNGYRRKAVFRYMDDQALRIYVEGIACPGEHGYQLCYSVDWETRIYVTSMWRDMDIWRGLPDLNIPTLILRGSETNTFGAGTGRRVQWLQPGIRVETVEKTTHLLPLERPHELSGKIQSFLLSIVPTKEPG